jgi:hypothetical protein
MLVFFDAASMLSCACQKTTVNNNVSRVNNASASVSGLRPASIDSSRNRLLNSIRHGAAGVLLGEERARAERTAKVYQAPDPVTNPVLGYNPANGPRRGAPPLTRTARHAGSTASPTKTRVPARHNAEVSLLGSGRD